MAPASSVFNFTHAYFTGTETGSIGNPSSQGSGYLQDLPDPVYAGADDTTVFGDISHDTIDSSSLFGVSINYTYVGHAAGGAVIASHVNANNGATTYYLFANRAYGAGESFAVIHEPVTLCFARGTQVATPSGERAVEALAIGDLVLTADGRAVPVKWIGRQAIGGLGGTPAGREPVRIETGALGGSLPARDLVVTSDHALLLDGVLVHAGALVNGTTIRRMTQAELRAGLTVFHIETENHEIVLAEGVPAETFVDNVTRRAFDNYAEFDALYGPVADAVAERDEPRAMSARQVPAGVRRRIAEAAGEGMAVAA